MIHMIAEVNRHAGHADIVRELIDGMAGLRADNDNMAPGDRSWWADFRTRVQHAAEQADPAGYEIDGGEVHETTLCDDGMSASAGTLCWLTA